MRELVVLPFVPVTVTVLTSFARRLSSSGYILSAMRPGIAVPPRCRMRETRRSALHTSIANTALKFIGGLLAVKIVAKTTYIVYHKYIRSGKKFA